MTLRRRILLASTALVAASCVLFGAVSFLALGETLHADAHARLQMLADAIAQVVDTHAGRLSVDPDDRAQIRAMYGPDQHVSVVDRAGALVFGERAPRPERLRRMSSATQTRFHEGGRGTILVWQSDAGIAAIQRTLLLAELAIAALVVAAGTIVARRFAHQIADQHELERLQASIEAERRFVADASHELRTPLAVLRAETDLALRRPRTHEEYLDALRSIDGELHRLEQLVDDLLDTMRERAVGAAGELDLAQVVARLAARVRPATRAIQVRIPEPPPTVRAHAESIERAAAAVLHNAIAHGGGSIDVAIVREANAVRIDIADDGPGFGTDALAHATERFWRGDSARTRGGSGLGLAIARVLIEANGGHLRLANAATRGAVVSLVLPTA
jgi:signal transduction histidine kinase